MDVLRPYIPVFLIAFFASVILTPLMRGLALRNGVIDWPDLQRKRHPHPVAYLGGAAIFLAWLAGMFMCFVIEPHDPRVAALGLHHVLFPMSLVVGALVVTLVGLFDDVWGVSPRVKLGGQLLAAAALAHNDVGTELVRDTLVWAGMDPAGGLCYFLGAVLIAVFVLGGCNALNLMDGMDGSAAGVAAIAAAGLLGLSLFTDLGLVSQADQPPGVDIIMSPLRIVMCLAIGGAVLGFLPYNFHPARIFMGDAGSLLLGYLIVSTMLLLAHAPASGPALVLAGLMVFALPIIDTLLAIIRRKLLGKQISTPDSEHLHHVLLRRGLSVKAAAGVLYLAAAGFAVLGCSVVLLRGRYVVVVFAGLFGSVIVAAWLRWRGKGEVELPKAEDGAATGEPLKPASRRARPWLRRRQASRV